jgi:hypothetical protein
MKKVILSVTAIALSITCSFAGDETKSGVKEGEAKEAKAPEMDDQTTMAIYPFADRNGTPVHSLDDGTIPTQSRIYFANTACRTWWLSQPFIQAQQMTPISTLVVQPIGIASSFLVLFKD